MKKIMIILIILLALSGCEKPVPIIEKDTEKPVITLNGLEEVFLTLNDEYIDEGCNVSDNVDVLEVDIKVDVDTSKIGSYFVTCNATDLSGNVAEEVTRTVHVTNKEPGMIISFTYQSYDLIGVFVQVFDLHSILTSLHANLYLNDEIIQTYEITSNSESFEFQGLETGVPYDLIIEGSYQSGLSNIELTFSKTPISVGTYRKLDNGLQDIIEDPVLFNAIQNLFYLPYDASEDIICEKIATALTKIDSEYIIAVSELTEDRIILTDGPITSVYEYFDLRGLETGDGRRFEEVSGVCCNPMVVTFGNGSIPEKVLLHEFGHSVDISLFGYLSLNDQEFLSIWEQEKPLLFPTDTYFDDPLEYFAEVFAYYYYSDILRAELFDKAPLTYEYIENLKDQIESLYN